MVSKSEKQRKKVTQDIENAVIAVKLIENKITGNKRKLSAGKIREYIINHPEYKIPPESMPKKRAVERILRDFAKPIKEASNNPLDKPWCAGASLKYDISPEATVLMLRLQKIETSHPKLASNDLSRLTIRLARWISRLYPAIAPLVKSQYPDNHLAQHGVLLMISEQYAELERIADITHQDHPDTSFLDKLYFLGGDADINEGLFYSHNCPELLADYQNFKKGGKK